MVNECQCPNGVFDADGPCPNHNGESCEACDDGYHLVDERCQINVCNCENGNAAIGPECPGRAPTVVEIVAWGSNYKTVFVSPIYAHAPTASRPKAVIDPGPADCSARRVTNAIDSRAESVFSLHAYVRMDNPLSVRIALAQVCLFVEAATLAFNWWMGSVVSTCVVVTMDSRRVALSVPTQQLCTVSIVTRALCSKVKTVGRINVFVRMVSARAVLLADSMALHSVWRVMTDSTL